MNGATPAYALPAAAAVDELRTLRDLVRFGTTAMAQAGVACGHGFPDPATESTVLAAWVLGLPPGDLDRHLDARLLRTERETLVRLLRRRVEERVPLPYLTGEAWLGDFRFRVDPRVLIPRSFIADLVLEGLAPWVADPGSVADALDLCTGSGCLAVLVAHVFPNARVDAVDLSPDALAVASLNVADHGLESRVRLVHSDLFGALAGHRYHLVVSNPPYVDADAMAALPAEYRHEPAMALAAGDDGLDLVRRLLSSAADHLHPGGLLVVEVGHHREAVESLWPRLPFTWLETHAGDGFVFLLTREQLTRA